MNLNMKTIFLTASTIFVTVAAFPQKDDGVKRNKMDDVINTTASQTGDAATGSQMDVTVSATEMDDVANATATIMGDAPKIDDTIKTTQVCGSDSGSVDEKISSHHNLVEPFSLSELVILLRAFRNANFSDDDLAVLEEVSQTSGEQLKAVPEVLKKIDVENIPTIMTKLDELGIDLTDFITNPGIFFEFLDDPVKLALLTEVQELLPKFKPADIETFLILQERIESAQEKFGNPNEPSALSKLFKIPLNVLVSVMTRIKL